MEAQLLEQMINYYKKAGIFSRVVFVPHKKVADLKRSYSKWRMQRIPYACGANKVARLVT